MSQQNVQLARRGFEAFNRHDAEAMQRLCTEDVEFVPMRAALEDTAYVGADAMARAMADFDQSWDDLRYEVEEIRDAGSAVIVIARLRGRGSGTGVEVDAKLWIVMRFRDERVASIRAHTDAAAALEAAGLSEHAT